MTTNFPTSLDSFTNPRGSASGNGDFLDTPGVIHGVQHQNLNDAVAALEAKVGINGSAVSTSLQYKVDRSIKTDGSSTCTGSIPFAQGASFAGPVSISYNTATFSISRPAAESWNMLISPSTITQTFSNGSVDPDYLTWTSTLLAFTSTLQGYQVGASCTTGIIPFVTTSTTKCPNLNADLLDGLNGSDLLHIDGSVALTANWNAGLFRITCDTLSLTGNSAQIIFDSDDGSGITTTLQDSATASAKVITLPNISGTVATLASLSQTFAGTMSFTSTIKANNTSKPLDLLDGSGLNYASVVVPSLGGAITLTTPSSTTTLAGLAITQSFTGTNTFTQTILATNTSGGIRFTGSLGGLITLSAGAASGNTTFTIPNTTTTAAGVGIAQTFTQLQTLQAGLTMTTAGSLTITDLNIVLSTSTGTKIGTGATQKIGFWNATPVVQQTGWGSITNVTTDRVYDANSTTLDEIADVLGTLVNDLKTYGVLGT